MERETEPVCGKLLDVERPLYYGIRVIAGAEGCADIIGLMLFPVKVVGPGQGLPVIGPIQLNEQRWQAFTLGDHKFGGMKSRNGRRPIVQVAAVHGVGFGA